MLSLSLGISNTIPVPNILKEGPDKVPEPEDKEGFFEIMALRNDRDTIPMLTPQHGCQTSL